MEFVEGEANTFLGEDASLGHFLEGKELLVAVSLHLPHPTEAALPHHPQKLKTQLAYHVYFMIAKY